MKKVFVSGCFDMLHSGHIAFLEEASKLGELYVGIGSDKTIQELKGRKPIYPEMERLYMIKALRFVKDAWINSGNGIIDFENEVLELKPDIIFVNEDGFSPDKQEFCRKHGIVLIVGRRIPADGLPVRSTTTLRKECRIPYRLDLAGGWIDQPFVSKYYPGAVITICIEPDIEFNDRSGMASSTRKKAIGLWQTELPRGDREKTAKILFTYENPPGSVYISGSQDSIGIVYPGVNRLDYGKGEYWPWKITTITDENVLKFIEDHIWLINLSPRKGNFSVLDKTHIYMKGVKKLAEATNEVWNSILELDLIKFGKSLRASFEAQVEMFPLMVNPDILNQLTHYSNIALGWKISGAGGGGYLVLISEKKIENAFKIRIRRDY
ncbi:MAG: adenylyltransferase/cytidyltransferase family protein [Bacteroidales bacterium]